MTSRNLGTPDAPAPVYPVDIQLLIDDSIILPGDCVLVHGPGDALRWIIERVQRRLLADLAGGLRNIPRYYRSRFRRFARFTHTRTVLSALHFGEMYRPCARAGSWTDIPAGTVLLFRRHIDIDAPSLSDPIAEACRADIAAHTPYATRELLTYYLWSWGFRKLALGRKFADVFRSGTNDVCSGRYIYWLHAAELMLGERPEAWYPARLAIDKQRFRTIACLRIV